MTFPEGVAYPENSQATTALILGIFVLRDHFIGSEIWGPLTAVLGMLAGLLTLIAGRHVRRRSVLGSIVLLWLVVAVMGVSGAMDHARSVLPAYIDQRPRPEWLPLIFSAIAGAAIAAAVRLARHHSGRGPTDREGDR